MLRNFSDGAFAIGVFVGFVVFLLIFSGIGFAYRSEGELKDLFLVLLGAILALAGGWFVMMGQEKRRAIGLMTSIQVKFQMNMVALLQLKDQSEKAEIKHKENNSGFPICCFLPPSSFDAAFNELSSDEVAFLAEVLPEGKQTALLIVWLNHKRIYSVVQNLKVEAHTALRQMNFPPLVFVDGVYNVDKAKYATLVATLTSVDKRLSVAVQSISEEVGLYTSRLTELRSAFLRKTGHTGNYNPLPVRPT